MSRIARKVIEIKTSEEKFVFSGELCDMLEANECLNFDGCGIISVSLNIVEELLKSSEPDALAFHSELEILRSMFKGKEDYIDLLIG